MGWNGLLPSLAADEKTTFLRAAVLLVPLLAMASADVLRTGKSEELGDVVAFDDQVHPNFFSFCNSRVFQKQGLPQAVTLRLHSPLYSFPLSTCTMLSRRASCSKGCGTTFWHCQTRT